MNTPKCSGIVMPCGENGCMRPAYGFVAVQDVDRFYDYESALMCGTVFPDLVYPWGKDGPMEILGKEAAK